jgi:signal transduction histidine kinase
MASKSFNFPKSLGKKILIKMCFRLTLVITFSCIYTYYHNKNIYDQESLEYTAKNAEVRAEIDSDYFLLAEKNVKMMQKEFIRRLTNLPIEKAKEKFNELFAQEADGHWRNKGIYKDYQHYAPSFISSFAKFSDTFYKSCVVSYEIANEYGAAFKNKYYTSYILLKDGGEFAWSPEADYSRSPLCFELLPEFIKNLGGSPEMSPKRELYWTDVYFDKDERKWMITVTMPIDFNGEWIGGVSHDLLIDDSLKRAEIVGRPGAYNLVFSKSGELIVSNQYKKLIEENDGHLALNKINNPKLFSIWEAVAKLNPKGDHTMSDAVQAYIGIKKIEGPEWLLVQVVPYRLVQGKINQSIALVIIITLLALLFEIFIIYRILKKEVVTPLSDLIETTNNIYATPHLKGELTQRMDELGILANSIKNMAQLVNENKTNLENKVAERTKELSISNSLLLKKNSTLDQLNQEKNKLISIANHDLKNPLTVTMLLVDIIKQNVANKQTDNAIQKLNQIKDQSQKMMSIINEHLNYILIEENSYQVIKSTFNFANLIDQIVLQNEIAIKNKNLNCLLNLDHSITLSSSIIYCEAIIDNLLSNAIKYSEANKNISIDLTQNESQIQFTITDQGMGIPKDEQHLIFQKFVKLSNKPTAGENSSGIGLSIVRQLVDKLGAKISFTSNRFGTKFLVEFPRAESS